MILMKKEAALVLTIAMALNVSATGCYRQTPTETSATETSRRELRRHDDAPSFEEEPVDVIEEFETYYAEAVDTPWVLENHVPFTHGNVTTYFNQFITSGSTTEVTDAVIYNNQATLFRPAVIHYPAEEEGYTVYEINYVLDIPMCAYIPQNANSNMRWWYHDVCFLDYYTGMTYPSVDLSIDTDSYSITGDVVYNGETYTVSCYAYREVECIQNEVVEEEDGRTRYYETATYMTVYFIVPTGYDGIVMYIYTADDSDETFEECLESTEDYYNEPHIFGEEEDENFEDYAFISISELG